MKYDERKEEYQRLCLAKIKEAREGGTKKALVVMASGLGKTIISARDVREFLQTTEGRTLYLCHNNDILEHARDEYMSVFGSSYSYGIYNGVEKHLHRTDFLFASFQTMKEHKEKFARGEFAYIVVDEAHHIPATTYRRTLEYFEPEFTLGLTATPDRRDKLDITVILGEVVYNMDLIEAIARGYLARVRVDYMMDEVLKLGRLLDKDSNERVSLQELNREVFAPRRDEDIVSAIAEKVKARENPRMIVYCRTIRHAERIAALMSGAVLYHSDAGRLPDSVARQNLRAFRDGAAKTIVVVDKFNEGIDVPEANMLVFLRQTVSPTVFYQQLGRGLRLAEGKADVLVLDFIANCERILTWEEMRGEIEKIHPDEYKQGKGERARRVSDGDRIVTNFDRSEFQSRRVELIEAIERVRSGARYTEEILAQQLWRWSAEHDGKSPTYVELSKSRETASMPAFLNCFGVKTWNEVLKKVGMSINEEWNKYTREEKLQQLRDLEEAKGCALTQRDINKAKNVASVGAFVEEFGSIPEAKRLAGCKEGRVAGDSTKTTKDAICAGLVRYVAENGMLPSNSDIDACEYLPSSATVRNRFGSLEEAYKAAGLDLMEIVRGQMQRKFDELGRTPMRREVDADRKMYSSRFFMTCFEVQTWNDVVRCLGFEVTRERKRRENNQD